jgi:hypothetical protein
MGSDTRAVESTFDLDTLLHPAKAFAHPMNVVRDRGLSLEEKRAILASWASDACAVEAAPDLRRTESGRIVRWDDVMDALRVLDRTAQDFGRPPPRYKRILARKRGRLFAGARRSAAASAGQPTA